MDLDYQGDPAWECLVNQKDWLLKLLTSCQEDHKTKGESGVSSRNFGCMSHTLIKLSI